jgi:hypothetical protein
LLVTLAGLPPTEAAPILAGRRTMRITSKGQVTIETVVRRLRGTSDVKMSTDEILALMRT